MGRVARPFPFWFLHQTPGQRVPHPRVLFEGSTVVLHSMSGVNYTAKYPHAASDFRGIYIAVGQAQDFRSSGLADS